MKKILFTLIFILLLAGCSEKKNNRLIGKWKVDLNIPNIEAFYEFSENELKIKMTGIEMPEDNIETSYRIKSDNGQTLFLEVLHPNTGIKGVFTFTFEEDAIATLTDPDGSRIRLTKEPD